VGRKLTFRLFVDQIQSFHILIFVIAAVQSLGVAITCSISIVDISSQVILLADFQILCLGSCLISSTSVLKEMQLTFRGDMSRH
jgi:hypothetical protein